MYDTAKTSVDQPVMTQNAPHQRGLLTVPILFAIITALFVAGSGGSLFYVTIAHPAELNAQATAVVRTITTKQAQATVISSPQHIYALSTNKPPSFNFLYVRIRHSITWIISPCKFR